MRLAKKACQATAMPCVKANSRFTEKRSPPSDLSAQESALIRAQVERCEALIRLDEGKHLLLSRRYREAATAFSKANIFYNRASLRVTLMLLGIMPAAVRWIYLISLRAKTGLRHLRSRAGGIASECPATPETNSSGHTTA